MATTPKMLRGGVTYLFIDGSAVNVVGDVTAKYNQVTRESLKGLDSVHGYSELPEAPSISFTMRSQGSVSVLALNQLIASTIKVQFANGSSVIYNNAWFVGDLEQDAKEATVKVKFETTDENIIELTA